MERRDFLKLMGTAAALTASQNLLAVPGVEPKIQLLEKKKIITASDGVFVIRPPMSIYNIQRRGNQNISRLPIAGSNDVYIRHGIYQEELSVEFFFTSFEDIGFFGDKIQRVIFDYDGLRDFIYLVSCFNVTAQVGQDITATIEAIRVHS